MEEQAAVAVAQALDGVPWNSGGGICIVLKDRSDGSPAVLSDEVVCE